MTAEKQAAVAAIEKKADLVAQVADEIWSFAELSLQEEQSADLYCRVLEQEGFKVERGIATSPPPSPPPTAVGGPSSACWRNMTRSPAFPRRAAA